MNFDDIMQWLARRVTMDLEQGVPRMQWLLERLGQPQWRIPTVHVVGTNGKGSTVNALQSICRASGYRVGRFTSPSIIDFREQIVYEQQMISKEEFCEVFGLVLPWVEELDELEYLGRLSEFEIVVAMMFIYFAELKKTDILLVEAGMGGLYDATNVLCPLVVICPSIGLDHQSFLGDDYVAIARHKVAVVKEGVPFVYATDRKDVEAVFEERAMHLHAPTFALNREIKIQHGESDFSIQTPLGQLSSVALAMKGRHQRENAALAVMAAELLEQYFPNICPASMLAGLACAVWPGRIECYSSHLILDGAHNNESIAVLCQFLQEEYGDRQIEFLFAAIHTKPIEQMLQSLAGIGSVSVTTFSDSRAMRLEDYPENYPQISSFAEWLSQIEEDGKKLYVVTGSLYFITHVRKYLVEQSK